MNDEVVLIGGPSDGQRVYARQDWPYVIRRVPSEPLMIPITTEPATVPCPTVETVVYDIVLFGAGRDEFVRVGIVQGMTPMQAFTALLDHYATKGTAVPKEQAEADVNKAALTGLKVGLELVKAMRIRDTRPTEN